jgi:hypothetical protein
MDQANFHDLCLRGATLLPAPASAIRAELG